jgi:hypothetical protein
VARRSSAAQAYFHGQAIESAGNLRELKKLAAGIQLITPFWRRNLTDKSNFTSFPGYWRN